MVLLPAADPLDDATVAAPPAETAHPEYVYLSRVVEPVVGACPSAKMPTVLFPAAEPILDAVVAAPPELTVQPEYVYLLRVVNDVPAPLQPKANIPNVPSVASGHSPCPTA